LTHISFIIDFETKLINMESFIEQRCGMSKIEEIKETARKLEKEAARSIFETHLDLEKLRIATELRVQNPKSFSPELNLLLHDLKAREKRFEQILREYAASQVVWSTYLSRVKGIGLTMAGGLVAFFDPRRAPHVSSYWKRAGLHVVGGHISRKSKGEKLDYNPKIKSFILGRVAKQLALAKGFYYDLYKKFKREEEAKHRDACKCKAPRMHIHRRAARRMAKVFLQHFWIYSRQAEGLPTDQPYAVERLGHKNYIEWQPDK